jgi:hypothetical protein
MRCAAANDHIRVVGDCRWSLWSLRRDGCNRWFGTGRELSWKPQGKRRWRFGLGRSLRLLGAIRRGRSFCPLSDDGSAPFGGLEAGSVSWFPCAQTLPQTSSWYCVSPPCFWSREQSVCTWDVRLAPGCGGYNVAEHQQPDYALYHVYDPNTGLLVAVLRASGNGLWYPAVESCEVGPLDFPRLRLEKCTFARSATCDGGVDATGD